MAIEIGFEDLTGGGDNDFEDVVFSVTRFQERPAVPLDPLAQAIAVTTDEDSALCLTSAPMGQFRVI